MQKILFTFLIIAVLPFSACTIDQDSRQEESAETATPDPLPSWEDTGTKQEILTFVEQTSDPENDRFVPVSERIAVFDNDGTLWAEQPLYFQLLFAMDRVKQLADEHPEWASQQPFKGVLENQIDSVLATGERGLVELMMATHAGMTTDEFEEVVTEWINSARHPDQDRSYTDLVYQPMLELIRHLKDNQFKVFIVSGGGIEFMRPWVEEIYGIPKDQVVGSSIKTEFRMEEGKPVIRRLPAIDFIDDKAGKPAGIWRFIGRKPLFAAGNSDGDLQMMQFTDSRQGSMVLYIHHTDSVREWAYDRDSHIGRLDLGLDEAEENGWTVVNMRDDWKQVFSFQKK